MEDKDRALVRWKPSEPAVELVAVVDGQGLVCGCRCIRFEQDDIRRELTATSGFGVAGVDQDAVEPRVEPIKVAQRGQLAPHLDERYLDRVLGEVGVAKDPMRDEDAAVADLTNQRAEGLFVALSRLVHDRSQHSRPPGLRRRRAPSTSMSVGFAAIVRYIDAPRALPNGRIGAYLAAFECPPDRPQADGTLRYTRAGSSVAEQGTFNPLVVGSNPTRLATVSSIRNAARRSWRVRDTSCRLASPHAFAPYQGPAPEQAAHRLPAPPSRPGLHRDARRGLLRDRAPARDALSLSVPSAQPDLTRASV